MRIRPGLCQNCGARYQIPASFPHDRARCRQCGGEVFVEAAQEPVAAAEPARPPVVPGASPARTAAPTQAQSQAELQARADAEAEAELEVLEALDVLEERPPAPPPTPRAQPAIAPQPAAAPAPDRAPPIPARMPTPPPAPAPTAAPTPANAAAHEDASEPRAKKPGGTLAALKARAAAQRAEAERAATPPAAAPAVPARSAAPATPQRAPAPATAPAASTGQVASSRRSAAPSRPSKPSRAGADKGRAGREEPAARGRAGRAKKERNPLLALGGVLGVVAALGLAYYLFSSGALDPAPAEATAPEEVAAADSTPTAPTADPFAAFRGATGDAAGATAPDATASGAASNTAAPAPAAAPGAGVIAPEGTDPNEALPDGLGASAIPTPTQAAGPSSIVAEARAAASNTTGVDPASIDLSQLADFGPLEGTSDEEWKAIQDLATTLFNPLAGARGGRASRSLIEKGKAAVPALLNGLKRIEFAEMDGVVTGSLALDSLQAISGLTTAWKRTVQPADQVFNKRTVQTWFAEWERIQKDPARLEAFGSSKTDGGSEEGGGDEPNDG
ncbi:MAG: hypothetical protein GC161_05470 [Planctomycetaceae bacterium]|nr:hypothetical protein [Planctomycetaceae bacterium]